ITSDAIVSRNVLEARRAPVPLVRTVRPPGGHGLRGVLRLAGVVGCLLVHHQRERPDRTGVAISWLRPGRGTALCREGHSPSIAPCKYQTPRAVRGLVVAFRPWLGRPGQVVVVRKSDQPHE